MTDKELCDGIVNDELRKPKADSLAEHLGFEIRNTDMKDGTFMRILYWLPNGGFRPANSQEIAMWDMLTEYQLSSLIERYNPIGT